MESQNYLKDEIKRLNRINILLEKRIIEGKIFDNEPERIVCNVKAMCEIAKMF